ncbi:MAG: Riboflavin transporter [Deltaproteobacteria bacterium ADurb.Bin510]|nr:MAG: Riboflavin transporter [Deltaproteobacteria bacterium ADurb.Bin510]
MRSSFSERHGFAPGILRGGLCILGSALAFAVMGAMVKGISGELQSSTIVFLRNVCALAFMLPWLVRERGDIRTSNLHLHLMRTAFGLSSMYCYYYALAHLKLGEAMLLSYTSPVFIPLIAGLWLKERITGRPLAAMALGFIGIVLVLKPGVGILEPVALVGLLAGFLSAATIVTIRRMAGSERPTLIVFYFSFFSTLISAGPFLKSPELVSLSQLGYMLGVGAVALVAQMFMTKGYNLAPASKVGPLIYVTVVFAALIGLVVWGEKLDGLSLAGAVLVMLAGFVTSRPESEQPGESS